MPRRVAFCITELNVGGAERALVALATGLDRSRFLPVVYSLGPRPAAKRQMLVERLDQAGIATHFLDARSTAAAPRVAWRLAKLLRQQQPEILQSFLFHANVLGSVAGRWAKVPHVLTGIRVAERQATWHRSLARWTSPLVERHVCVSQAVADFSAGQARLPADRLVVIPNGVDVERFATAEPMNLDRLGVPTGRSVFAVIGRLEDQKGIDWLLAEVCPAIFRTQDTHDLLIVGDGPERSSLERLAVTTGVAARVHFASWQADIPAILAAVELVVSPSRWEGMSNVLLEAMAAQRAVVATAVEGTAELLGGSTGSAQLVALGDAQDFSQKVVALLRSASQRAELGAENQRLARREFSIERMVARYQSLFESLH